MKNIPPCSGGIFLRGERKSMVSSILSVVREAGEIIRMAHDVDRGVREKEGAANFVTVYDSMVQRFLFEKLRPICPDALFVGEEDSADDTAQIMRGLSFVIDPIDGTQNFLKGFRHSAVSVALCEQGNPIFGVVYNPYTDEMFYAEQGKGAFLACGGTVRPMHVSTQPLAKGVVLFGTAPYYRELYDDTFRNVRILFEHALDIRRCGSAALDLCMIADGRAEVYMEMRLSPWDYAAGLLIVREAGGVGTELNGSPLGLQRKSSMLCGNPQAYADARALL